jgi:hypothetical protein
MSGKRQRRAERAEREKLARQLVDMGLAPERPSLANVDTQHDPLRLAGQLAAAQDRITISVATPHGRHKLYSFSNRNTPGNWHPTTPIGKLASPTTGSFVERYAAASKQKLHSSGLGLNGPLGATKTVYLEDSFEPDGAPVVDRVELAEGRSAPGVDRR